MSRKFYEVVSQPEFPELLLQRVGSGESLKDVARSLQLDLGKLMSWVANNSELNEQIKSILSMFGHSLALEALRISDNKSKTVSRDKLRVETRLRIAKSWAPRTYGEHTKVEHSGSITNLMAVLSSIPREVDVTPKPEQLEEKVEQAA